MQGSKKKEDLNQEGGLVDHPFHPGCAGDSDTWVMHSVLNLPFDNPFFFNGVHANFIVSYLICLWRSVEPPGRLKLSALKKVFIGILDLDKNHHMRL